MYSKSVKAKAPLSPVKPATARVGRAARTDAYVETIERKIERDFKLPSGCVKLVRPNGRKFRSDASIQAVLKAWNKA
jgi:hypothetical protein